MFAENTTITQHLEEHFTFSALRFDITSFNIKATYWLHNMGWHSTVRIETPGDPIHFPALSSIEQLFHLRERIGEEIGHDCAQEANLYIGTT